jgi:uncharacterized linocin/CFP29 family protein
MDDRNAQVGWTEAQWNRVREEVLQAWQRVRVAGSFLPTYGPLPPSTQVVPTEVLSDGAVDDRATAALLEIALPVTLSRQQLWEEDLSSALLQFRRRATQLGQLEDWYIFNGTYPSLGATTAPFDFAKDYRPELSHLDATKLPDKWVPISGTPKPIQGVGHRLQIEGMRQRNPGSLGLIEGPRAEYAEQSKLADESLDNKGLTQAILGAINSLEEAGYVAPYVCVLGREPFQAAFTPLNNSTVVPRDRIEPLIGRGLLHASSIDVLPHGLVMSDDDKKKWPRRGVLLSMSNEPIDLALAAEATPEFRQVDVEGGYVFSVSERFALRIKDAKAIVPLMFKEAPGTASSAKP